MDVVIVMSESEGEILRLLNDEPQRAERSSFTFKEIRAIKKIGERQLYAKLAKLVANNQLELTMGERLNTSGYPYSVPVYRLK